MRHRPRRVLTLVAPLVAAACGAPAPAPVAAPVPAVVRSGGGAPAAPTASGGTTVPSAAGAAAGRVAPADTDRVSEAEVERRAAAIFGRIPGADSADAAVMLEAGDARATWDIDVRSYETHARVETWVNVFSGRLRDYMARTISRGTRYEPFLRRRFREAGLPEDMTYLALIESAYNPHAYSRAAAVGMWQFMTATARGVGMRVDHWVDERRDPVRATEGAIDFLSDLHEAYGSWYLAAAAYNGGPGRVSRGLARFADQLEGEEGDDRFFALADQQYLPRETKDYVPKLIAAALVAKEPQRYGIVVDTQPLFAYDSVVVGGGVPLAAIARAAGVATDAVTDLNPHLLRGVTPPGEDTEVRIPVGSATGFAEAFAALPDAGKRAWREERLAARRSVTAIAEEAGVPLRSLRWYNPRLAVDRKGRVAAGTLVRIPTADAIAAARDVPDPSIERYGRAGRSAETALVTQRHRVRRGETLSGIAKRYGVPVSQLRQLNGVSGNRLVTGQTLVVKRPSRSAVAAARRRAAAARADDGVRCTSRVVKTKAGKRRTVRRCTPVRSGASARRAAASTRATADGEVSRASAKKATGTKVSAKKTTAKKSTAKKSTAKKSTAKKSTTRKSTAKKSTAKKSTAKKSTAKKSTAKKSTKKKPVAP